MHPSSLVLGERVGVSGYGRGGFRERWRFLAGHRDGKTVGFPRAPDGLAVGGPPPPLDPSTTLRVSGPSAGDGFPIGVGNDGLEWETQRDRWCGLTRQIPRGASGWEGGDVGMGRWGMGLGRGRGVLSGHAVEAGAVVPHGLTSHGVGEREVEEHIQGVGELGVGVRVVGGENDGIF